MNEDKIKPGMLLSKYSISTLQYVAHLRISCPATLLYRNIGLIINVYIALMNLGIALLLTEYKLLIIISNMLLYTF